MKLFLREAVRVERQEAAMRLHHAAIVAPLAFGGEVGAVKEEMQRLADLPDDLANLS